MSLILQSTLIKDHAVLQLRNLVGETCELQIHETKENGLHDDHDDKDRSKLATSAPRFVLQQCSKTYGMRA